MEGLLIAEQLRALGPHLPAERLAWRFPDDRTAVLPLAGGAALWLGSRPPTPYLDLRDAPPRPGGPRTPFQHQLAARAAGPLLSAEQVARDRVVRLGFGPSGGFVPLPGAVLVCELTGRHANLVLLSGELIVGVERVITAARNRYRELRPGLRYVPPPPYEKVDPVGAPRAALAAAMHGRRVGQAASVLDGVGPELTAALVAAARAAGVPDDAPLEGRELDEVAGLIGTLAGEPSAFLARWRGGPAPMAAAGLALEERARERLRRHLKREHALAERRLGDALGAVGAAREADDLRRQADLLLARAGEVPAGASSVTLEGFDGEPVTLTLEPQQDAAAAARARYDQARRREGRAERARRQLAELRAAEAAAREALDRVEALPGEAVAARLAAVEQEATRATRRVDEPGIRFLGPHGFEVVVGRNAKDNDRVTFEVARSRDLWLHAQGYRGAHVIVRSGGRSVPPETLQFAARLAAGHSEARREARVAVDYTERKNVWRPKGGGPGAVEFAHHRTVVVAPARDDEAARG